MMLACVAITAYAQEAAPPLTPSQIADKLSAPNLITEIEAKNKLLDIARKYKFEFKGEAGEKLKSFLTEGISSKYFSSGFKLELFDAFTEFEILLSPTDPLYSDSQILLSLPLELKKKAIDLFFSQGLYDEPFQKKLLALIKSGQWPKEEKLRAVVELVKIPLPSEKVNEIRGKSKTYVEFSKAIGSLVDKIWDENEYREKIDKQMCQVVMEIGDDDILLFSSYPLVNAKYWDEFFGAMMAIEEGSSDIFAIKRLKFFSKKAEDMHVSGNVGAYKCTYAYLTSLLADTNGFELSAIPPEQLYLFLPFLKCGDAHPICLAAIHILNRYHKNKPYFDNKKDWIAYLEKLKTGKPKAR